MNETHKADYAYFPQEDVTVYELAVLLGVFTLETDCDTFQETKCWEIVKRHFKKIN